MIVLSPTATAAGAERTVDVLARKLPAYGFDVVPILFDHGPLEGWLRDAGVEPLVLDVGRVRYVHRTIAAAWTIRRVARRSGATIILAAQRNAHVYSVLAAVATDLSCLWWQQNIAKPKEFADRFVGRLPAKAIICSSHDIARSQLLVSPKAETVTIYPGVPLAEIESWRGSGYEVRQRLAWPENPIIGIVGRLDPWKHQDVFLRAAAQVSRSHPLARFAVIGGPAQDPRSTYPGELEQLARELGLEELVHFSGHVDDVYRWIDALDIAVHCSIGEPFGLVLVEAMALGKPLVSVAGGAPEEIVGESEAAILVPFGHVDQLAAALRRLLDQPELAGELAGRARKRATCFSDERMAARVAELFRSIQDGHAD